MSEDAFSRLRAQLVEEISREAALTAVQTGRSAFSERVMQVIGRMPRHEFVPVELQQHAYLNRPLPIGYDKTVSQPFIVALMSDLLEVREGDTVLEIGAGAGYQAAVLAALAARVHTVEIIEALARGAEARLSRLGCTNVEVHVANGYYGLPRHAPYDRIMVTAAAELIPPLLLAQLKPGGRMVIPTGIPERQALTLVEKSPDGRVSTRDVLPVRFSEMEEAEGTAGAA